jgi:hypothetical protein
MGIEEENGCWNQSNVKVVNVNLNLLRVHVNQCYRSKLGYVPRRSSQLLRHDESENFIKLQTHRGIYLTYGNDVNGKPP